MIHTIRNNDLSTELDIDETLSQNTCICIKDEFEKTTTCHYLTPKELNSLIGTLLHVQAKKRKEYKTDY